jgi:hypothetical protein
MKLTTSILIASSFFTGMTFAMPGTAATQVSNADVDDAECADLGGVLRISAADLPEGVSLSDVRKCRDHPADSAINATSPNNATDLVTVESQQSCYYQAQYGCTFERGTGYCWKHCGESNNDGKWCWTANGLGLGSWITCDTWDDCGTTTYACSVGCARCGCGC